jgi:nicotinate-nucleotide pyrophosphorylase (carboxylating)
MPGLNEPLQTFLVNALKEDIGTGDITTELTVPQYLSSEAEILSKDDFILSGITVANMVFNLISTDIIFNAVLHDGHRVRKGDIIANLNGPTRGLLMGERTALNLLQRLSGIASLTGKFVDRIGDTDARIIDTRKTTPNMRSLEKYAVKVGGGYNHRFGLYDGILVKDNHVNAAGGVKEAVERIMEGRNHLMKIEIEVKTIGEFKEALSAGADVIMLDNMSVETMKEAVQIARNHKPSPVLEASGGITEDNVRDIALTGVDFISVGALTHSAPAVDISMKIIENR